MSVKYRDPVVWLLSEAGPWLQALHAAYRMVDMRLPGITSTVVGVVVALVCGCADKKFKIETRINSDGTVDRAICQPGDTLPGCRWWNTGGL